MPLDMLDTFTKKSKKKLQRAQIHKLSPCIDCKKLFLAFSLFVVLCSHTPVSFYLIAVMGE
jgi:hypothetical protein